MPFPFLSTATWTILMISFFSALSIACLILAIAVTRKKKPQLLDDHFAAIAGDDVMTTQLDLARAYLEMDKADSAKKILKNVLKHGTAEQQKQAQDLILETH